MESKPRWRSWSAHPRPSRTVMYSGAGFNASWSWPFVKATGIMVQRLDSRAAAHRPSQAGLIVWSPHVFLGLIVESTPPGNRENVWLMPPKVVWKTFQNLKDGTETHLTGMNFDLRAALWERSMLRLQDSQHSTLINLAKTSTLRARYVNHPCTASKLGDATFCQIIFSKLSV